MVVAVVASHSTEAPETDVQPVNVKQSPRPPSFWAWDRESAVIGCSKKQVVLIENIFPLWFAQQFKVDTICSILWIELKDNQEEEEINGMLWMIFSTFRVHYSGRNGVSNQQPHDCLLNRLFHVTGLCAGNSPHRWLVNSPYKWPVTRKKFPFDDVIMVDCAYDQTGIH